MFFTATSLCILREPIRQNDNSWAQEIGQHRNDALILLLGAKKQTIQAVNSTSSSFASTFECVPSSVEVFSLNK